MNMPLTDRHCRRLHKGSPALSAATATGMLAELHDDWSLQTDPQRITRVFNFKNYYETIAFVNALAWIAHTEDHHPDIEVSYNRCTVHFSTHSVGGLSENDFICAAKLDALYPPQPPMTG